MTQQQPAIRWGEADPYERYMGRWSRPVAREFLRWLEVRPGVDWADIGCGTGALTEILLHDGEPRSVQALDKSPGFLGGAAARIADPRARFQVADATELPLADACCDAAVSALVLNFVDRPAAMASEMARIVRPGGTVAAYVWDYADGMQMIRMFWAAALAVCGPAEVSDETRRFPLCAPEPLAALWREAGLAGVEARPLELPMRFADFDDYWQPFLGKQGAAPGWLAARKPEEQEAVREWLRKELPVENDGSILLKSVAWGVKGVKG